MEKKRVVVGGTFEFMHKGHRVLLGKAFELGDVFIGLVSDEMAKNKRAGIKSFKERESILQDFAEKEFNFFPEIREINDKFGFAVKEDFDFIVVSPETYPAAMQINEEREKKAKKQIEIIKIDFVLAEDGLPISSTRIFNGEIDEEGKLLK